MINNTLQNKSSKTEKMQEHELVLLDHLKKLYSSSESEIKNTSVPLSNELKWFNHIFYKKPISLLFSIDQFFFEFTKKQPRRKKTSEFQRQLKERKKLSFFYGYLSKKQLKNYLVQSKKHQGYFSKNFFSLLERRLDIVLYRSGLVKNIVTARQLISHKKVKVNNQILNRASSQVYPGDIISVTGSVLSNSTTSNQSFSVHENGSRKKRKKSTYFPKLFSLVHTFTSWKILKQKKVVKNFISLLLNKIEKRVDVKLEKTGFFTQKDESVVDFTLFLQGENDIKKNFALLKFKPLFSKQAQSFLFMCMQKKYLSVERKPLFSNKSPYFLEKINREGPKKSFQEKSQKKTDISLIYNRKRNILLYRNFVSRTLLVMHRSPFYSLYSGLNVKNPLNKKNQTNTLLTLKLKNTFTKKRNPTVSKGSFHEKSAPSILHCTGKKSMHLEVSYSLSTLIFLYSPQRINFPFSIDLDFIVRSFQ